jgi:hypothetical protein
LTTADVLAGYEQRLREVNQQIGRARGRVLIVGLALAIACALVLGCGLGAIQRWFPVWLLIVPALMIIFAARRYSELRSARYKASRLAQHYAAGVRRLTGEWVGNGTLAEELQDDLNVFGHGSLFELLCTARTGVGKQGLVEVLTVPVPIDEIRLRQAAVGELRSHPDLRQKIALLGEFDFRESNTETYAEWLARPPLHFMPWLQKALWITSTLIALLFLAGMSGVAHWKSVGLFALPVLAVQALIGAVLRDKVNAILPGLHALSLEVGVIREGFQLLGTVPFESQLLLQLVNRSSGAANALLNLEKLLTVVRERNKEWFYAPSLFIALGTQMCIAIENWRRLHGDPLAGWLAAWGQFEALNCLAGYAYENPQNAFPEFVTDEEALFEAAALGHPLIADAVCVRNNVAWNRACRFYIISGSNMAGKSTLLRAIGLNAVLARAGAPVRAVSLRMSNLTICASVGVTDSLLNGKSRFMAEMDRLRAMLSASEEAPVLFLIDEIMSGTNSRDRLTASEAVLTTLLAHRAIGAVSTHDLALTRIAELPGLLGRNMYMASCDGDDPLKFDYLLKPGITPEANALAIARLAGVPT